MVVTLSLAVWLGWGHIRFFWMFEPLGKNEQGFPEFRHRQTGIVMVKVPGGTFWMGAQKTDPKGRNFDPEAQDAEGPVHEVTLSPFLIGKYEVTQGQWKAVMGSNPSFFVGDDQRPVEQVSWADLQRFEAKTGLSLPTEAQWEYACRAGTTAPFAGDLDELAWYQANSEDTTHPVGQNTPNGFGLHDMHGNVCEWCEDVFGFDYYLKSEATGLDPLNMAGVVDPWDRVFRGGGWSIEEYFCRSSSRLRFRPALLPLGIGFRPAYYPLP